MVYERGWLVHVSAKIRATNRCVFKTGEFKECILKELL